MNCAVSHCALAIELSIGPHWSMPLNSFIGIAHAIIVWTIGLFALVSPLFFFSFLQFGIVQFTCHNEQSRMRGTKSSFALVCTRSDNVKDNNSFCFPLINLIGISCLKEDTALSFARSNTLRFCNPFCRYLNF